MGSSRTGCSARGVGDIKGMTTMTTHNHLASSQYIAAYQAEITSDLRNARRSNRLLSAVRGHAVRALSRTRAWLGSDNALEADTRQIRNFGQSTDLGACEVNLDPHLAT